MSTAADAPPVPSSTDVTLGQRWQQQRALIIIGVALLATVLVLAWVDSQRSRGHLDPDGVGPTGAGAAVALLRQQGVEVVEETGATVPVTAADTTVLVTLPGVLTSAQITELVRGAGTVVLVDPGADVERFGLSVELDGQGDPTQDGPVDPDCSLPAAQRAGAATAGSLRYTTTMDTDTDTGTVSCYDGRLVVENSEGAEVVVLGAQPLTNRYLGDDGNAALTFALLGQHPELVWYQPNPPAGQGEASVVDLLPDWVLPVTLQLFIAAGFAAWWRARRLGPVVTEALPVVVRSVESTEGTARLYRRGRSRGHAAHILRAAATERLRTAMAVPRGAPVDVVAVAVADRTGRDHVSVKTLLAGPDPSDDTALIRLADDLDTLERQVQPT